MNRIDRVTAILIQLQSKKVVKAQEIADRFNISLRTVYRDVKTLEEAGIPLIGEAGVGYSIMDGYRLPPIMFTREEATAFITAEKLVERFTDTTTNRLYKEAMYKIKAVLRGAEKDVMEDLDERIAVMRPPNVERPTDDRFQCILKSITAKEVLRMQYFAMHSGEHSTRDVEPIGTFFVAGYWHLIAYCRLRNGYRDFRLDRIQQLKKTDIPFNREHLSLREYLKQVALDQEMQTVKLLFEQRARLYIRDEKYYYGFVQEEQKGDHVEMTFLVNSLEGIARWLLLFGRLVKVVSPVGLHDKTSALVAELTAHYG